MALDYTNQIHNTSLTRFPQFSQSLLVDSLFTYVDSTAAVIDTTGNFDVVKLYALILARLQSNADADADADGVGVQDIAARMLERVKIMRVFDFVGVKEAVDEVREGLEGGGGGDGDGDGAREKAKKGGNSRVDTGRRETTKRTVVADSEGEDEDEDEDDAMLFDHDNDNLNTPLEIPTSSPPPTLKFLLLTNLSQVITPLLKNHRTHPPVPFTPIPQKS